MDIKKLNDINFNIEIKVTESHKKKAAALLFKNARLFFLIFLGLVTIYCFDLVFKKAYVDINYIQYPAYTAALGDAGIQSKLDRIVGAMEKRKDDSKDLTDKAYADPFSYRSETAPAPAEKDGEDKKEDKREDEEDGEEWTVADVKNADPENAQ